MGEEFIITVKVESDQEMDSNDDVQLLKAAIVLTEAGMGTFEQCCNALRTCCGDEGAAVAMLLDMQEKQEQVDTSSTKPWWAES